MAGKILKELKQTVPFSTIEEEAVLNIVRTADVISQRNSALLKQHNLSATQYNVLRILRGAGSIGVSCKEIASRMVTPDPDVTRLMDRLEKRGLLTRDRAKEDRRFITIRLTAEGLALTNALDGPVKRNIRNSLKHVPKEKLEQLIDTLELIRSDDEEGTNACPEAS